MAEQMIEDLSMAGLEAGIDNFLAAPPYYPCLLLVHPEIARLNLVAGQLLARYDWPELVVGAALSEKLLGTRVKDRPRQARRLLIDVLKAYRPGPILCRAIDLLFEPELELNPLPLLGEASRRTSLVALWPGSFIEGVLAYGQSQHAHYRTWPRPDLGDYRIIPL
jgi:hypothetical protein